MKFSGSNKLESSFESFYYRIKWRNEAYTEGLGGPKMSKDFVLYEKHLYNLINYSGKPVHPLEEELVPFPLSMTNDEHLTAMPYFKQQVMDLKAILDSAKFLDCPKNNRWINNLTIYRAYEPPKELYAKYLKKMVADFVDNGINGHDQIGKRFRPYNITRFEHFVNNFLSFCELKYGHEPILYSTWYTSVYNSMYSSGLRVKICDLEYADDQPLYDELINTPEFEYYKKAVQQVGLAFDLKDPSVLVPDFGSPLMANYFSPDISHFAAYFELAYTHDYNLLYNILINMYNIYVNQQEQVIKFSDSCGKLKWTFLNLYNAPINPELDDLSIYLKLKSIEDPSLNNSQLDILKKNSEFLQKRFDKMTSIRYISDIYLNLYYSKPFSFNELYKKFVLKKEQELKQIGTNIFGGRGDGISGY